MDRSGFSDLALLTGECAASVVEAQRRFDRDHAESWNAVLPAARQLSQVLGLDGALALLPPRLLVRKTEITTRVAVRRTRAFSFSLMVKPINLGFQISHQTTESTDSQIRLEIEQIPFPAGGVIGTK